MLDDYRHRRFEQFAGLPVVHVPAEHLPADVENWAWRVETDFDGPDFGVFFDEFLRDVDTSRVRALLLGSWITDVGVSSATAFGPLVAAADRFPRLRALFLGDIESQQHEISWITHDDITPLLEAFPQLEVFGVRGGTEGLALEPFRHDTLRELTFQAGGLPAEVVRAIGASDLPALTDLELYLGTPDYGGGATGEDLAEILTGARLPNLRYLGLRDAENADDLAVALAHAPIVAQLEVLDLSLGALGDVGVAALLAGQPLTHLKRLDLHHHYLTVEMWTRLQDALPGVDVDLADPQDDEDDDFRYVAVAE